MAAHSAMGGGDESRQLLPKVIEGLPAGTRIRRFAAGGMSVVCELGDDSLWSWGEIAGFFAQTSPSRLD